MLERRVERLEEDMTTIKLGVRRMQERVSHMDSAVSSGGWISDAFEGVHQEFERVERRIDSVEQRLANIEERLEEQKQMLAMILERLSQQ
jgi:chaperonin cofactor prefoldin